MRTKITLSFISCTIILLMTFCSDKKESLNFNREINFNSGWKFINDDVSGAMNPALNDSGWRNVILPHDWSIEDLQLKEGVEQIGPFSKESAGGASTGHVVGGTSWYRKHFFTEKGDDDKIIKVLFDGIYMNTDVWINGKHLGNHPYGYTAFYHDLTTYLNPEGEENVLAVQVKNEGKNSRWYSGSGIYRNVVLIKNNLVYIEQWSNYITTREVSNENAVVRVESKIVNKLKEVSDLDVLVSIIDPEGKIVAKAQKKINLDSGKSETIDYDLTLDNSKLWSLESPHLYTAIIEVRKDNKLFDKIKTKFGVRTIEFSAQKGFLLNGKNILLKGACMHHDNGPLGAAAFNKAEYRRVKVMKDNGFNAIRTAHNPPSKAFLDACDELGMLVMDESFDQWQKPKNPEDYNLYFDEWWEKDMESMLLRDRNHPSVIIWSIGNEIKERADSSGLEIAKKLKQKIYEFDKTRPITNAICEFWDNPGKDWDDTAPAFALMDVHGYNYQWARYEDDIKNYPNRIIIGTESIPKESFENWQLVENVPNIIGDFVWTGMDYLGESGIGHTKYDDSDWEFLPPWPWYNAWCGDISILGYKKPQMLYRDVVWRNSDLEILVHSPVPKGKKEVVSFWGWPGEQKSWNWEGYEGTNLTVRIFSRGDEVRLELNGKEIGTKSVSEDTKLTAQFEVPYKSGELLAVALKNGKEIARQSLKTSGAPAALKISAEHDQITADPGDLAYFNIEVVDNNGLIVPNANVPVLVKLIGDYKLQAFANGNPSEMRSFQKPEINTFQGRCQLIVRSCNKEGEIKVEATSTGLIGATSIVRVAK